MIQLLITLRISSHQVETIQLNPMDNNNGKDNGEKPTSVRRADRSGMWAAAAVSKKKGKEFFSEDPERMLLRMIARTSESGGSRPPSEPNDQ